MRESAAPRPPKIADQHLERVAAVYIRQSTLQQVANHQESTKLQYKLSDHLERWGWPTERILTIDDDLGESGTSVEGRPGFQRLVTEVSMNHIGLVIGREVSRLARSSKDWHHLLELCGRFDTLVADSDGVYDPSDYNDRLLLGLKGTMSEAELHMMKERMLSGKLAKAKRGELKFPLPMGYVWSPDDEILQEADSQARSTIQLIFDVFDECGSINGLLEYLVDHHIEMPHRRRAKPNKGKLEWRRPNRATLSNLLHHPIYTGAYVYGRRQTDRGRQKPGRPSTGRIFVDRDDWHVLLKDNHAGYISWERYERNLKQLRSNRSAFGGPVRDGQATLSGLIQCGRCGHQMALSYQEKSSWRYACHREAIDYGKELCQSFSGRSLDELVEGLVLQALEPASLELSLEAIEKSEKERERLEETWSKKLERAEYEAQQALERYEAVDPNNRLVAQTLEDRLEEALQNKAHLEREYERQKTEWQMPMSDEERAEIRALADDLPSLWHAQETAVEERQTIIRTMIDEIVAEVEGETEQMAVTIEWAGGAQTQVMMQRPVASWEMLTYYDELVENVRELFDEGLLYREIADELNERGYVPPRNESFTRGSVISLLQKLGLQRVNRTSPADELDLEEHEWTAKDLAVELEMPKPTLYNWIDRGEVVAEKRPAGGRQIWVIEADESTLCDLKERRRSRCR